MNMTREIVGSVKAQKSSKDVSLNVYIAPAQGIYPARVLIGRTGLSENEATFGYIDAADAIKLGTLLVKAGEMVKALPVDEAKAPGPVTSKGAAVNGDVAALASQVEGLTTIVQGLIKAMTPNVEDAPVTRGRARASRALTK